MLRFLYIFSLVLSLVLIIVSANYMGRVSDARNEAYGYSSYDRPYNYDSHEDEDITVEAGKVTMPFFAFYLALGILTLLKLKTKTMKVLAIIGSVLTLLMFAWDFIMMGSPGGVSFDETGGGWIFFGIVQIAFGIIGCIHAFRTKA
jgi:hypothetical protein